MKEKIQSVLLKEIVGKPEFSSVYELREFAISVLDVVEDRNKLDHRGFFDKSRKVTLGLGWRKGTFNKRATIRESKNKNIISIGFGWKCRVTKHEYYTERYLITGSKPEDPIEDSLNFVYINSQNDQKNNYNMDLSEIGRALGEIKGLFSRAVEHNRV
ncbi:MAG: hypothetical protein ABIJ05_04430 [Patescibacteria group bacterium]